MNQWHKANFTIREMYKTKPLFFLFDCDCDRSFAVHHTGQIDGGLTDHSFSTANREDQITYHSLQGAITSELEHDPVMC